jgi:hypothetical protein
MPLSSHSSLQHQPLSPHIHVFDSRKEGDEDLLNDGDFYRNGGFVTSSSPISTSKAMNRYHVMKIAPGFERYSRDHHHYRLDHHRHHHHHQHQHHHQQHPQKASVRFFGSPSYTRSSSSSSSLSRSAHVQVQECLHRNDYTEEEKRASWYSTDEIDEIRTSRKTMIKLLDRHDEEQQQKQHRHRRQQQQQKQHQETNVEGTLDAIRGPSTRDGTGNDSRHVNYRVNSLADDAGSSVRGLERMSKLGRRQRHLHTRAVVDAVVTEQESQFQRGVKDEAAIAYICQMYTRQCVVEARRRGVNDAREAAAVSTGGSLFYECG